VPVLVGRGRGAGGTHAGKAKDLPASLPMSR
jgi:hypothetical protein